MASGVTHDGLSVEISVDDAELRGYLEDIIDQSDKFHPAWVVNESEHSLYVEFGTNGAHFGQKSKGTISPVELEIRNWAEAKFRMHGKERDAFAHSVYRKLMREGMPPQPYFRPAVNNVMQMVTSDPDWFDKDDNSLLKIAELIAEEMKRILYENNTPVSGDIINKIDYFPDDGSRRDDVSSGLSHMPQNVLDSLTADLNGDEQRAADAKKRRIR